jgi:hypothetical protein
MKYDIITIYAVIFILLILVLNCEKESPISPEADHSLVSGYWKSDSIGFVVLPDSIRICGLTMSWPYPGACGVARVGNPGCISVDINESFTYEFSFDAVTHIEGSFISDTTITGTWKVDKGSCNKSGIWSAIPITKGPLNCTEIGLIEIYAWVDNPNPKLSENVNVYGLLLDDNKAKDDISMNTEWHFETTTKTCDSQANLTKSWLAICSTDISDAKIGRTVFIDVTITYMDHIYTTSTSFTPR